MDGNTIQNLRYKLQRRVRRLNGAGHQTFHYSLKQFWGFIMGDSILMAILEDLEQRQKEIETTADDVMSGKGMLVDSEDEGAALSLFVIKKCVASDSQQCEVNVGYAYGVGGKYDECIERFRDIFLVPIYDYLDEHLDDQRAILSQLIRYKHSCEWFRREELFALWDAETTRGEESLSKKLYEYLYDKGIDISIEPRSASGKPDFISMQSPDDPLVADAKIFCPDKSKGKSYLVSAFHQIYQYTLDYNQPFGYLVIFKTCAQDLDLGFAQQESSVPFVTHNHKTIFFVVVDIFPHEKSASKRGQLKGFTISEEEIVAEIEEQ
jgi:hypothetical protein